ncbi:MAG: hypothetical protein KY452_07550 [Actinobacteria bacterium]|nr:hypothetical protein [Actinomycetota bacterium]
MSDVEPEEGPGLPGSPRATPSVEEPATDEELASEWADPPGLWGHLRAVQNDAIGKRLLLTGFFFLILGGSVDSLVMRLQLARPESDLLSPQLFNELFTNHGSVTMFLVILPIVSLVERPEPLPYSITEAVLGSDKKAVLGENTTPAT